MEGCTFLQLASSLLNQSQSFIRGVAYTHLKKKQKKTNEASRGVFQKAGSVKALSMMTLKGGKLWVFSFLKRKVKPEKLQPVFTTRGITDSRSVAAVTHSLKANPVDGMLYSTNPEFPTVCLSYNWAAPPISAACVVRCCRESPPCLNK